MNQIKRSTFLRYILILLAIIVMGYFIYASFGKQLIGLFEVLQTGNDEIIEEYLASQGHLDGLISTFLLSVLQVVSIVFPGMVIQIAAGVIYGWLEGFIVTYLGFVFGNLLVFMIARRLGNRISNIFNFNQKESWLSKSINKGHPKFIVALACMIPGIPNGIIPYVAAKANITLKGFGFAVGISSWIQILLNCLAGSFLISGNYGFVILSFVVQIVIIIVVYMNKDKIIEWYYRLRNKE